MRYSNGSATVSRPDATIRNSSTGAASRPFVPRKPHQCWSLYIFDPHHADASPAVRWLQNAIAIGSAQPSSVKIVRFFTVPLFIKSSSGFNLSGSG